MSLEIVMGKSYLMHHAIYNLMEILRHWNRVIKPNLDFKMILLKKVGIVV